VVLSAGRRAGVVLAARSDALGAPFRAYKVRECQGVFGHVGLEVVAAEAAVRESGRIAGVDEGSRGLDLLADKRADAQFTLAPVLPRGQGYTIGVDPVVCRHGDCGGQSQEGVAEGNHVG